MSASINSITHEVSETTTSTENQWGGITRTLTRTLTTTITYDNGTQVNRSHTYPADPSYDSEARRINILWLTGSPA